MGKELVLEFPLGLDFCLQKDPTVFWGVKGLYFGVNYLETIKQRRKPNHPLTEIEGIFNTEKGKERLN